MTQTAMGLEANSVIVDAMAESHIKARKVLDFGVEGLVTGSSPTLKTSNIVWIM